MSKLNLDAQIELIEDDSSLGEAFAAISLNPSFQWAKIVVTDDQPNANKHRIPQEEFDNIIKTGIFAPIKMAESTISRGHDEAYGKPIGLITQLTKVNNRVIALAALWKKEKPEEIRILKEQYQKGTPPNVSWELSYAESSIEDDGVEALRGVVLNGLAVVSMPAYTGRTAFIAMASSWNSDYFDKLPDASFLVNKDGERFLPVKDETGILNINLVEAAIEDVKSIKFKDETKLSDDEVTQLTAQLNELKEKIKTALSQIESTKEEDESVDKTNDELTLKVSELETKLAELEKQLAEKDTELTQLREYKASIEKEKQDVEKLATIKQKFEEAGIEKDETFWSEKSSTLLALDDTALDFMIQEMVSFAELKKETASKKGGAVPKVQPKPTQTLTPAELGKALRESKNK